MLERITYASTVRGDVKASDIAEIIRSAAVANGQMAITGVISIEGDSVCQVLEGPTKAIEELFDRIKRDGRHSGVVELDRRPISARRFGDWAMTQSKMLDIVEMAFAA